MAKAQLGRLAQARRQRLEATVGDELAHGLSLAVRGTRRADEVRMVRVCEPVRARSRRSDNGAFLEEEDGIARAGDSKQVGDCLGALRVCHGVATPVELAQAQALPAGEVGEKVCAGETG